tara:strand:- start:423 stop:1016 length:594 start_codon:yes stop_codon:yes gene_type:complete
MLQSFSDLIYENNHALTTETCEEIIQRFRHDDRKAPGITTSGEVMPELKKSMDLGISDLDEWEGIDQTLYQSLAENLEKYSKQTTEITGQPLWSSKIQDSGYNVKRYRPDDYYNWHVDCQTYQNGWTRTVACIWYLNAVEEGGETEFAFGHKVVPSTGKLILFPATWNFPHRGLSPIKGNKYIITSFVLTNEETQHG